MSHRLRRLCAVIVSGLALAGFSASAASARAQGYSDATVVVNQGAQSQVCGQQSQTGAFVAAVQCPPFGAEIGLIVSTASAVDGHLRSTVDVTPNLQGSLTVSHSYGGWAISSWTDRVLVAGPMAAEVDRIAINYYVVGWLVVGTPPISYTGANAQVDVHSADGAHTQVALTRSGADLNCTWVSGSLLSPGCGQDAFVYRTFTDYIEPGDQFTIAMRAFAVVYTQGGVFSDDPLQLGARSHFGNSLQFSSFAALDKNGHDITAGTTITFQQGTLFTGSVSTVPEPAAWLLLGSGLLAVGVARRRWPGGNA